MFVRTLLTMKFTKPLESHHTFFLFNLICLFQPSSCLTDKEEDEIYGFGYGVFGRHMAARQQQQRAIVGSTPSHAQMQQIQHQQAGHAQPLVHHHHHNYQT